MPIVQLSNRSLVSVSGSDAEHFLDNLITCQVVGLGEMESRFGALLTPQGKIMFDFFLVKYNSSYLIEINTDLVDSFIKRLQFYKLRANVDIQEQPSLSASACWNREMPDAELTMADPRHPDMGWRIYGTSQEGGSIEQYHELRIQNAIAEGGMDYQYGDAYPHEVLMDQWGGIDFQKGCYVGQEVVSRMQHRGTAKKRLLICTSKSENLDIGMEVKADGKPAGIIGSTHSKTGLAILRMDRIAFAQTVLAEGIKISASIPTWARFVWPERK